MKGLQPKDPYHKLIFRVFRDHPEFERFWDSYKNNSPHLGDQEIIWNIITDYDDAFNTGKPYPYSETLYNRLNKDLI